MLGTLVAGAIAALAFRYGTGSTYPAWRVGLLVNETNRHLMTLTQGSLRRLNIAVDPTAMTTTTGVGLAWNLFGKVRTEGQWTYLHGGNPTQTVWDSVQGGLQKRGPHNLRAWIDGIILREDRAERVHWPSDHFEVWE